MTKYQRVTYEHRCQIQAFLQVEVCKKEIAKELKFHKSTIYRELKRNSKKGKYCAKAANRKKQVRFSRCRRHYKIRANLEQQILNFFEKGFSPDQIAKRLKLERFASISPQAIYEYTYRNKTTLGFYLRRFKRRGAGRYLQRRTTLAKKKLWIHSRPEEANKRNRIGDWERDLMLLANRKPLLICCDRKSRFIKIAKSSYRIKETSRLTSRLISSTGKKAFSITNDNGPEFRDGPNMNLPVYYCEPQKPQQRGTVENTIGLLRQYFKRTTDIQTLSHTKIKAVETALNLRPRRCLDYLTPYEVFYGKRVALAS